VNGPAVLLGLAFTSVDGLILAVIAVLLVMQAFLAMAEVALTRIRRARAAGLDADASTRSSRALVKLVDAPETFLNALLLVVLAAQTAQTALTTVFAERVFGSLGVVLALVVNVAMVFVITEAAPKTWAVQHLDRAALLSARPVQAFVSLPPLRMLARGLIGLANVILPGKGIKDGPFVTEEELLALAEEAAEASVIEADEQAYISRIISFGDTIVREVMVPRTDMVVVDQAFRVADAMEVVLLNGFSRIPVVGQGIDDVVGVIYAKDLMRAERDGRELDPVAAFGRPTRFVPETKPVADLLREMQADKFHMAIVIDEYGGTAGLVTLEDLIEELVGEIVDEFDVEDPMIEPLPGGVLRVNGRLPIDEANEVLVPLAEAAGNGPVEGLPEGDWDTVAGLLFNELGHVASEGDTVTVNGFRLRVDKVQGRRISRVRISRDVAAT
jgi:CBS domain containing-hemolysin-like protein